MNEQRSKAIDAIKPLTPDEIEAGKERLGVDAAAHLYRVESALRAQAACMEEQGARIVKLERRQADIERRVACLDSMADEHAKGIEAMKSRVMVYRTE